MGWSPLGPLQDPAQHDLAIRVRFTSWDEAQAGVEAERIAPALDVVGQKLGSPGCPYEVDHLSHGLLPVILTLVVVDELSPEQERAVVVGRRSHDVPRHHDEADRLLAGVDRSAPGVVLLVPFGLQQPGRHRRCEKLLRGRRAQDANSLLVVVRALEARSSPAQPIRLEGSILRLFQRVTGRQDPELLSPVPARSGEALEDQAVAGCGLAVMKRP